MKNLKLIHKNIKTNDYKIPESVISFLNENFDNSISLEIIKYYISYLKENNIHYLNWYLDDINEIKIRLKNLENRKFNFDEQKEKILLNHFVSEFQDNDKLLILTEFKDEFSKLKNYNDYNILLSDIQKKLEKEKEKIIERKKRKNSFLKKKKKEKNVELIIENEQEILSEINASIEINPLYKALSEKKSKKDDNELSHEWNGTSVRFKNQDGTWGKWVDLQGATGTKGGGGGIGKRKIYSMIDEKIATITGSSSISDPLSSSIQKTHQLSSSYFLLISGSTTNLSATHFSGGNVQISTATISAETVVNSTMTNLSASQFSASNVQISTATFTKLSSSTIYIYDLVVQNSNITGTTSFPFFIG